MNEFLDFLKKYAVIGAAIGIVTGQAVTNFVKSLVDNLLQPVILKFFSGDKLVCNINSYTSCLSNVLSDTVTFVITMLFVFFIIKFLVGRFLSETDLTKAKA